ncbi:MAG: invasion associated locus B family protein [Xanthobacteraceae bacterium]
MDHRILSAAARPMARAGAAMTATSIVAVLAFSVTAVAQQSAKPLTTQKPATPAAGSQAKQPEQGKTVQLPPLIYSDWTKICVAGQRDTGDANGKAAAANDKSANEPQVCLTGIEGRTEAGPLVVSISTIEPSTTKGKGVVRVVVPLGMDLKHGTRFIIDKEPPMTAPYVTCFVNGCISNYELNPEVLNKLKKGKTIVVQAIGLNNTAVTVPVPLQQFAKAHDGPPTDPKVLAEQQKKLEEELKRLGELRKKQADDARQKLEQSQQQAPKPR